MENSTIALVVWIVVCVAMAVCFIWCMVRDSGGTPANMLHFTPPTPPPTWHNETEKKFVVAEPWFLVIWEKDNTNPVFIAADKIERFETADGVFCVKRVGVDEILTYENKHSAEFLPASCIDMIMVKEKDAPTAKKTWQYWHERFKNKGLLDVCE